MPQQNLGGDAPDVQAHTTPVFALDDGDGLSQLSSSDGRDIPARPGAEHEHVDGKLFGAFGHGLSRSDE